MPGKKEYTRRDLKKKIEKIKRIRVHRVKDDPRKVAFGNNFNEMTYIEWCTSILERDHP